MEQLTTRFLADTEKLQQRVKDLENRNEELSQLAQITSITMDKNNIGLSSKVEQATFQLTSKLNQALVRVARLEQQIASLQGNQPSTSHAQSAPIDVKRLMHVVADFAPADTDEIMLNVGNMVFCNLEYQDGWGSGFNTSTGFSGFFPMSCVSDTSTPRPTPVSIGIRTASVVTATRPAPPVPLAGMTMGGLPSTRFVGDVRGPLS
ncbi:hypothetical protein HDU93_003402 [Gonapodya sp. JEL0774]|nr:hypothetical protein HDU93_003402 [Gonapodya sp. JEL0774]